MEDSTWGLIILVIVIVLIVIVLTGFIFFRSINKNPDNTESSIGNKCSSKVPCPKGLECSKFFCQNPGITTGDVGAFCLPNGQFPTTSGSSSPGCNSTVGLNCITNVCAKTNAGLAQNYNSNSSDNLIVTMLTEENSTIYSPEDVVIFSGPLGMTISDAITIDDGMTIGSVRNSNHYPVQNNELSGARFGPVSSRRNSARYSGRYDTVNESGRSSLNGYSQEHIMIRNSGGNSRRYDSRRFSGRYSSESNSERCDSIRFSGRHNSNRYPSPKRDNHNEKKYVSWKVNQRGDVSHYNRENQEWENIFPSGFSWLVGGRKTRLTAKCMSILTSDSGDENVVVSFKSFNSEFPHSLFYEIVTNQGRGRSYILIPWTSYRDDGFNGQIFCPVLESNFKEDEAWLNTSPKSLGLEWAPIVGSKIELQKNGDLWIQGHMIGSKLVRLFIPSSGDPSKEYFSRDGKLY